MNELVIPVFVHQLFTKCPKCQGSISIPPHYNPLTSLGYQCSGCLSRFIIVQCPNCKTQALLNSTEWNELRKMQAFKCEQCGHNATLKTRSITLTLSPVRMGPQFCAWLDCPSEKLFLEHAEKTFTPQKIESIALVHYTIGARIKFTKEAVHELRVHGIKTFEMYNNRNLQAPLGTQNIDVEDAVFRMSNALISGLEMITQEGVASLGLDWGKGRVSFNDAIKYRKFLSYSPALHSTFCALQASPEFQYLTKLRNCIHHRWSVPFVIESEFIVESPGTIEEDQFPSSHMVLLPDNPDQSTAKITFHEHKELLATFEALIAKIEIFADGVYQALYLALQER